MQTTTSLRLLLVLLLTSFSISNLKGATHIVNINPTGYSPSSLQVGVGDTVFWINQDDFSHTVTSLNNVWTKGYLFDNGDTWGYTFTTAGTYSYYCDFDGFTGTISVVASTAPANDQCSGAIAMTLGSTYNINTATATSTGDPVPICASLGKGVWYSFTAASSGSVTISTCGSSFDTVLAVYTGSCGALAMVSGACNDDNVTCSGAAALVTFSASAGTTYRILAGGYNGASGNLSIMATASGPANDQCAGAIPMTAGVTYTMNTASATGLGDPSPTCLAFGKGVWYSFTPTANGTVVVRTCGSSFDTGVAVFSGSCASLVQVACNDENGPACSGSTASVSFNATSNTTYRILAGGYAGASGNLQITTDFAVGPSIIEYQMPYDIGISLANPTLNVVYLVDSTNDRLLALNTQAGTIMGSARLHGKTDTRGLMCQSLLGDLMYVPISSGQKLQVISLSTMTTVDIVPLTVAPKTLAAGSDGMLYAIAGDRIVKINPSTGQTLGTSSTYYYQPILKANASGTRLYVMELGLSGGSAMIDELSVNAGGMPLYVTNHFNSKSNDKDFVIAEDINTLYSTSGGVYGVGKWDMTTRTYQYWPYDTAYGAAVSIVPGDSFVYGASADYYNPRIRRFNRSTGAVSATWDLVGGGRPNGSINDRSMKVTPNGRIVYAREGRRLGLIGASSFSTNLPATAEFVFAGADRSVVSGETFALAGVASTPSGSDTFTWTKIAGPGLVSFDSPNASNTTVRVASAGSYVLEIARNSGGLVSRDRVNITATARPTRMDQLTTTGGVFQMRLSSEPGLSFTIEGSTNLVHWETVTNIVNSAEGFTTINHSVTNQARRFYRTRLNP